MDFYYIIFSALTLIVRECLMITDALGLIPAIALYLFSYINLIIKQWKINIAMLFLQFISIFWLISWAGYSSIALIKLIVGWMLCSMLFITLFSNRFNVRKKLKQDNLMATFRALSGIIIIFVIINLIPDIQILFPQAIQKPIIIGFSGLVSLGLLQTSFSKDPLNIAIGLVTFFSGFELLHSSLESSALLTGLLAGVNLIFVLIVCWMIIHNEEVKQN